jgi:large subunit ribosomal protein L11
MAVVKTKTVLANVKLQIPAGKATPTPPVGPALGSKGVNSMEFCKAFNAKTADLPGLKPNSIVRVQITIYTDKTFTFVVKTPPVSLLIKDVISLKSGSKEPGRVTAGSISREQLETIAKIKMPDITAADLEAAIRTIAGSARSMGLSTTGVV